MIICLQVLAEVLIYKTSDKLWKSLFFLMKINGWLHDDHRTTGKS